MESTNTKGIIRSSLIRSIAKPLVPKNKSQFLLLDDLDGENWRKFLIKKEKITIFDNWSLFRDTGGVFMLKGDILSMISDYGFNRKDSPDAKQHLIFG